MKKKDTIYSAELIVDDLADGLPDPTPQLSHFDDEGQAQMVDVSAKALTRREAVARHSSSSPQLYSRRFHRIPRAIRWRLRASPESRRQSRLRT